MKIIDRYLISHFLKPLGATGVVFTILVMVGHFFDKMGIFNSYHAHVRDIVVYLILGLPYWLNLVFPVATLLALMFSVGQLQQRAEIAAMRSAGISSVRLYAPFIGMGMLISLISLIGGMTLFPSMSSKANVIYRRDIKQEQFSSTLRDHVVVTTRDNKLFTIGTLDAKSGTMTDIVIDQFNDQALLLSTLSAQHGHYQNGHWTFNEGLFVQYDANGNFQQEPFHEKVIDMHQKPEDFLYEDRKPDDMTYSELRRRLRQLHELGIPSFREQVALNLQFSLPFANVVVILLGLPFALSSQYKGRVQTLAYALVATFLYWGTVSVFQSFGEQGHLPAWVSAWAANFIFGIVAAWRLWRSTNVRRLTSISSSRTIYIDE